MRFDLIRPCSNCPFRSDAWFPLRRAPEIADSILRQDLTFACHKTTASDGDGERVVTDRSQHCAGALILHEKAGRPNWRIRAAHALGLYDPARLDMAAPVFDTEADFVKSCTSIPK